MERLTNLDGEPYETSEYITSNYNEVRNESAN